MRWEIIKFYQPRLVISKCINFAACRYNAEVIKDEFIANLEEFVDFIRVCPEVEIGLGVPRDSLRLVKKDNEIRLIQNKTAKDFTAKMKAFAADFITELKEVDGFILKNRSPSCGVKDTKVYVNDIPGDSAAGIFAQQIKKAFPDKIFENEGRLKNYQIREDFLTKIFVLAHFRTIKQEAKMKDLVKFQSKHKYLFMSYDQKQLKVLGRIVANHKQLDNVEVFKQYEKELRKMLSTERDYKSNINVLMHLMGYFSDELSAEEKEYFLATIKKYKKAKLPLSVPLGILKGWAIRYKKDYLKQQSFLTPYPEELVEIKDSGKGRDL